MAQVSYGTITITDTTDIERIYMVYAGSESNITPPDVDNFTLWKTDITQTSGTYIWQRAVVKKSGIEITAANFQQFYGEPVCITGEGGRSIKSITTYYCNYGTGTPDENYNGWNINTPEYDEDKPNYWIKTIIIYVDDSEEEFSSSGSIVSIEDGEHKQVTALSVELEPIQDLNGYDHPWVGGAGKNKVNCADISAPSTSNTTYDVALGSASYVVSFDIVNAVRENLSNTSFLNIVSSGANNYYTGETILKVSDNSTLNSAGANINGRYYCTVSNKAIDSLVFLWRSNSYATLSSGAVKNIMVEVGTTPSAYEPYSNICPISGRTEVNTIVSPTTSASDGQTYTTALGRTVYGGTLEQVGGSLTDKLTYLTIDGTTVKANGIATYGNNHRVIIPYPSGSNPNYVGANTYCIGDKWYATYQGVISGAETSFSEIRVFSHSLALMVNFPPNANVSTVAEANAWFAENTPSVVYELATPQTYQLTPQQIGLLLGTNHLWSDSGDINASGFTIVNRDVQIHLDNGLTNALAKSADAQSKATEALGKANEANQAVALMGGHFIYKSSSSGNSTPAGAGVIRNLDDNPANWGYNTWIGSNGIALRHGENILSKWMTTGISFYNTNHIVTSTFGDSIALASNGASITIGSTDTSKYNTYIDTQGLYLRTGTTSYATLNSNGLVLSKGGIEAGIAGRNGFIYLSTEDYPLQEYQLTSDIVINDEKTYYILNEDKYVEVIEPDVSDIATYYEISQPGITINNYTPTKINNEISNYAWREIIGTRFGVDSNGNLYANGANIKGIITAESLIISSDAEINDINGVVSNSAIQPDIDEAKKVATNYITEAEDTNEITVHSNEAEGEENNTFLRISNNNISINTIKGAIAQYGENIRLGDLLTYLEITSSILEFFNNQKSMARFGYDEIFESYGVQAENVFIKGAGNALRLDNNVNGTYQGQYILETRANGHLSLKPGLTRTEEE